MLLPLLVVAFGVSVGISQTFTSGEWTYTLNGSNEATIIGYSGPLGHIIIPAYIEGYKVARLGSTNSLVSFLGEAGKAATSISIPAGVEIISAHAFSSLTNLTTVEIPGTVKYIGRNSFSGCTNLTNVILQNGVGIIAGGAFQSSRKLTQVRIPNTVLDIGQAAFAVDVELLPINSALALEENFYLSLAQNEQFIEAVAARIKGTPGNYGIAIKTDFNSEAMFANAVAQILQTPGDYNLFSQDQYEANRIAGVVEGKAEVTSNPATYNLYTPDSIMDLRMGGLMVQKQGDNAIVSFQPQTTTDLTQPFTNNGTALTHTIPLPGNKGFLRIQAKPQ